MLHGSQGTAPVRGLSCLATRCEPHAFHREAHTGSTSLRAVHGIGPFPRLTRESYGLAPGCRTSHDARRRTAAARSRENNLARSCRGRGGSMIASQSNSFAPAGSARLEGPKSTVSSAGTSKRAAARSRSARAWSKRTSFQTRVPRGQRVTHRTGCSSTTTTTTVTRVPSRRAIRFAARIASSPSDVPS
jgi:hypothetical protein